MVSNLRLYEVYKALEACKRKKDEPIEVFIQEFKAKCADAERKGIRLSGMVKAFKMLEASGCSNYEKAMILADVRFDERNPVKIWTDMEESIRKIMDEGTETLDSGCAEEERKQSRSSYSQSETHKGGEAKSDGGERGEEKDKERLRKNMVIGE